MQPLKKVGCWPQERVFPLTKGGVSDGMEGYYKTSMKLFASLMSTMIVLSNGIAVEKETRIFEIRTYYAAPGKLDDLLARFRNHTTKLFEKHGMENIGYW